MAEPVEGSGAGDEWLIAAQSNHAALGYRMDLEIPMPLSEQRREISDSMDVLPKARLRREGIEPCTCRFWKSNPYSIRGLPEVCIIPRYSRDM